MLVKDGDQLPDLGLTRIRISLVVRVFQTVSFDTTNNSSRLCSPTTIEHW
jgi:hypothetical protein